MHSRGNPEPTVTGKMRSWPQEARLLCSLGCLLGSLLCTDAALAAKVAVVESVTPCFVSPPPDLETKFDFNCGYVVVPEDRITSGSRQIKLGFLRLRSPARKTRAPLFMLAGGPGSSLIVPEAFLLMQPALLGPILQTRDIVILDQRGTRHSEPMLDCADYHSLAWTRYSRRLDDAAAAALERDVLQQCVNELRENGVDLANYNSVAIAADVDAARKALGYRRITYYGASYGSQLGQHLMRDYPGILEAVVLDGANSLSRKSWIEDRALDVEFSLQHLTELCRAAPRCNEAYDIPGMIERGLALFDDGPLPGTFRDPKDASRSYDVMVRREDFVALVYEKLGYKIGISSLPYMLKMLVDGGKASMAEVLGQVVGEKALAQRGTTTGDLATIMHFAVVCSDDSVRSPAELNLDGVGQFARLFGEMVTRDYLEACQIVDVPSLPDVTDVDVRADIPTLILSGGLDAQTPTFRSEVVARSLPDARLVVFPDGTHVQVGAINTCATRIMAAFLDDPRKQLPLGCVDESRFPGFLMPDGSVAR